METDGANGKIQLKTILRKGQEKAYKAKEEEEVLAKQMSKVCRKAGELQARMDMEKAAAEAAAKADSEAAEKAAAEKLAAEQEAATAKASARAEARRREEQERAVSSTSPLVGESRTVVCLILDGLLVCGYMHPA
jgi:membrane protein involved in colicin uptake